MSAENQLRGSGRAELRENVVAQTAQLLASPEMAIVRPWVRTELEQGVRGVSRFTQYAHNYEFHSDESIDRGGEASAPSPMRYLLSGVAFCLQGWASKVFAVHGAPLDALAIELRTHMDMRGELQIADVPAYPQWLVADVILVSASEAEAVIAHVQEAAARCPLTALLVRAIPLYLIIRLRGEIVLDERPQTLQNEQNEEQTR